MKTLKINQDIKKKRRKSNLRMMMKQINTKQKGSQGFRYSLRRKKNNKRCEDGRWKRKLILRFGVWST